jgi:hypothetical protein
MPHSAELRLPAMQHSEESIYIVESKLISPQIGIYIQNRFGPWISVPGVLFDEKKPKVENLVRLSF